MQLNSLPHALYRLDKLDLKCKYRVSSIEHRVLRTSSIEHNFGIVWYQINFGFDAALVDNRPCSNTVNKIMVSPDRSSIFPKLFMRLKNSVI